MPAAAITIRRAVASDAAALCAIAERTFRDTFEHENSAADVTAHIAAWYSPDLQRAQIESPDVLTLLVENDGMLIGYAQLRSGPVPACITVSPAIELWHFYVDKPWLGQGIAQQMMQAVWNEARARGAKAIWLGVWERNPRAIAFYRKYRFCQVGSHVFTLGSDAQTDLILLAQVDGAQ
jgi:ribosomal protein S18 acetylase RimI-like enzyme